MECLKKKNILENNENKLLIYILLLIIVYVSYIIRKSQHNKLVYVRHISFDALLR